ncbi:hypothetical protein Patl1_24589 [Pistacia atlantica]|uniref:Uncharacterized protein n=1 Tax=Pistacia atlantica TaxID=434234 RepID=A0ACC1A215_9ROSI|nr:hypothetical protein Patl1_24589 [Pistacia atlantica]
MPKIFAVISMYGIPLESEKAATLISGLKLSPNQAFDGRNILSNFPQLQGCTKSPFMADKEWVEADYPFTNHSDSVLRDKVVPHGGCTSS